MKFSCKVLNEVIESISIIFILNLRFLVSCWVFYFKIFFTSDFKKICAKLFFKINQIILHLWFLKCKSQIPLYSIISKYFPKQNMYVFQNNLMFCNWIFCTNYISKRNKQKILFIPKITWLLYF